MAYYNINEIVKMTRMAKGISQEELSFDICTTATLIGYENGKHRVNRGKYRQLMERMGRMQEMQYAVCINKEGGLLEDRVEMERAFKRYDYAGAEEYVRQMKENADENVLTAQYLARAEALVEYYRKRISAKELAQRIDNAIRMTVPEYEVYIGRTERIFPFMKEELLALMSLGEAYRCMGECEKSIQLYETVLRCLDRGYMANPDNISMKITMQRNLSLVYEQQRQYEEALETIDYCLNLAKQNDYGHIISVLLMGKAHNYIKLVERQRWENNYLEMAKKILRQAYYMATARGDFDISKAIFDYYKKRFGEW